MANRKTAIVTGANRGIGREIARQLALRDVDVMLTARHHESAAEAAAQLKAEGISVRHHQLDVTVEDSILAIVKTVEEQWGRLDILVNNAGIFIDRAYGVLDLELDMIRKTMETNVYGPLRLSQLLFPLLRASSDARIINLSSGLGALTNMGAGFVAYSVSKTALNALTRKLAGELGAYGIFVNAMCPGWVKTEMGGPGATRSVEEGAQTAVWLALDEIHHNGGFFRDKRAIAW